MAQRGGGGEGEGEGKILRDQCAASPPGGHCVQDATPPRLYCPAAHSDAVDDVEPEGQAYPAAHAPTQALDVWLGASPYLHRQGGGKER